MDRVVLYIEDDLASRMVMNGALRTVAGVELICAETGEEGLAAHASRRPSLVLLDANLPDVSGIEMMRRLTAGETPPPVLVISADVSSEHVDRMLEAGASGCIAKPIDIDELTDLVTRFVD